MQLESLSRNSVGRAMMQCEEGGAAEHHVPSIPNGALHKKGLKTQIRLHPLYLRT